jgi:GH15 family glucan-1,4-alpha-glucosidase
MIRLSSRVLTGLSYRPTGYRCQDELNDDGVRGEEGTFVFCSFWLARCLAPAGEVGRPRGCSAACEIDAARKRHSGGRGESSRGSHPSNGHENQSHNT